MEPRSSDSSARHGVILMLVSVILFAVNTLLIRAVSMQVPAADGWLATLFRGGIGILVVVALHGFGRGLQVRNLFSNRLVILRGVIGALTIAAFYITIVKLGAGRAVLLNLTYPMFASIIAAVWLKEKLTRAAVVWMSLGIGGLIIFLNDNGQLLTPDPYDLLAIAGAIGAGWVVVVIRRLRHDEHPATIYAAQAVFSLLLAAPAAGKIADLPSFAWSFLAAAAAVVAIAQLMMTRAYQTLSVARGSSLQMLLPLATALGAAVTFGETFSQPEILGGAIILLSTWRVVVAD